MKKSVFIGIVILFFFAGCSQQVEQREVIEISDQDSEGVIASDEEWEKALGNYQPKSDFKPFPVYTDKGSRDNHFIPSGFMPDGKCLEFNDTFREGCHSGSTCIKVVYDVTCSEEGQKWAGVYWLNPANNWGKRKGGFNLSGAKSLTFWAKGAEGGEQIEEFKIGGVEGDYPDSDEAMIGRVILTPEWKKYSIDLRGKDLSYISGGFAWVTSSGINLKTCIFYLDDIRYE